MKIGKEEMKLHLHPQKRIPADYNMLTMILLQKMSTMIMQQKKMKRIIAIKPEQY